MIVSDNSDNAPWVETQLRSAFALHQKGKVTEANELYRQILNLQPGHFGALYLSGIIAAESHNGIEAATLLSRAAKSRPGDADTHFALAQVLEGLKQHEDALNSYDNAIRLKPDLAAAHNNRGNVCFILQRYQAALESYDRAIQLNDAFVEAHSNRGAVLRRMGHLETALGSFDKAITLEAENADVHASRAKVLMDLRRFGPAAASFDRALALSPNYPYLVGERLHAKMHLCDWDGFDTQVQELESRIERGEQVTPPLPLLAMIDSPSLHRLAAETWSRHKHPAQSTMPAGVKPSPSEKIRIGYFSMDFHSHVVGLLVAELIESHDRDKFVIYAFSFGPDSGDHVRKRLEKAFDVFLDVRDRSDEEIAALSRSLGIDIAVDLAGFTAGSRTGIFARRAAPLQVNYLGYPGTMGAPTFDYIIADPTVVPEPNRRHYVEKVALLPESYQANDATRPVDSRELGRSELGLPKVGFVFCCFNNGYKITPSVFDIWINILKNVSGSVLWLLAGLPEATGNLRGEARARGIDTDRLIFAERAPLANHLARHRAADLFLDTFPYNAHTTASDALWAGLPLLTRAGESFAARVGASLLRAVGLPELITTTVEDYAAQAIALATRPGEIERLRQKLARNRISAPLFNTPRYARHIEAAYGEMYTRYRQGLPAGHIDVTRL